MWLNTNSDERQIGETHIMTKNILRWNISCNKNCMYQLICLHTNKVQWNTRYDQTQILMKHKYWWNTNIDGTQNVRGGKSAMKQKIWQNTLWDETTSCDDDCMWGCIPIDLPTYQQILMKHNL